MNSVIEARVILLLEPLSLDSLKEKCLYRYHVWRWNGEDGYTKLVGDNCQNQYLVDIDGKHYSFKWEPFDGLRAHENFYPRLFVSCDGVYAAELVLMNNPFTCINSSLLYDEKYLLSLVDDIRNSLKYTTDLWTALHKDIEVKTIK